MVHPQARPAHPHACALTLPKPGIAALQRSRAQISTTAPRPARTGRQSQPQESPRPVSSQKAQENNSARKCPAGERLNPGYPRVNQFSIARALEHLFPPSPVNNGDASSPIALQPRSGSTAGLLAVASATADPSLAWFRVEMRERRRPGAGAFS